MTMHAVQTQGTLGVQWKSADGNVTLTTEQLIFQFMYAQCLGKDDIIQMDKEKVADITNDLKRAAELLAKLEDCKKEAEQANKAGAGSLVTGVLTDSEIRELNSLINNLGLSNLFSGMGLLPGATKTERQLQKDAISQLCYDGATCDAMYKEAKAAGYTGVFVHTQETSAEDSRPEGTDWYPEKISWTPPPGGPPTDFLEKIALRCLTTDLDSPFKMTTAAASTTTSVDMAAAYKAKLETVSVSFAIEGGINSKTTIREVQSGITILNSEISSLNTKQQGFLTDTSNDIAKKGSFLDGMKSFVDQMGRTRMSTLQQV